MSSNVLIFIVIILVICGIIFSLFRHDISKSIDLNVQFFKGLLDRFSPHGYLHYYMT